MSDRCPCGARIVWNDTKKIKDGLTENIYTCGVCGIHLEVIYEADPKKF
jgi:hypothetical protein